MTLGDLAMEKRFFSHLRWSCKFSWKTNLGHDQILKEFELLREFKLSGGF
jgi:hypothetical protein